MPPHKGKKFFEKIFPVPMASNDLLQTVIMVVFHKAYALFFHRILRTSAIIKSPAIRIFQISIRNRASQIRTYFRIKHVEYSPLYIGIFIHFKYIYYKPAAFLIFFKGSNLLNGCLSSPLYCHFIFIIFPASRGKNQYEKAPKMLKGSRPGAIGAILLKKQ